MTAADRPSRPRLGHMTEDDPDTLYARLDAADADRYEAELRARVAELEADAERLRARVQTLEHVAAGNKRHVQAILPDLWAAQAAVDRVRALARELADPAHRGKVGLPHTIVAQMLTEALDEPARPEAAPEPAVHIGGSGNAEDCPACDHENANLPYPWICPGPQS